MDAEETATPLAERKMMRRGLLAGLAALGAAAAMKVTGAEKAQAANNDPLLVGNLTNTATLSTRLRLEPAGNDPAFQAINGGTALGGRSGLAGVTDGSGASGVVGVNYATGGHGVRALTHNGTAVSALASEFGVAIRATHSNHGSAIRGISNAVNETSEGTGSGIGVEGRAGSGMGVRGASSSGTGVRGESTTGVGVRGRSLNFVGLVGESVGGHGVYGYTQVPGGIGMVGEHLGGGLAGYFAGSVQITGSLQVSGAKNAVIKMQDGTSAAVYCQESPEAWFEDFGRGQLVGGVAQVPLEREFATLVAGTDYMVFCFPAGDTRGLYVSRQTATGFEVREVQGGTASIPFTYRIVTKRKDIEARRFARVNEDAAKSVASARAALTAAVAPPTNTAGPGPISPPPPGTINPVAPNAPQPLPGTPFAPSNPLGSPSNPGLDGLVPPTQR